MKQETTVSCDEKRQRVDQPADTEAGPSPTKTVPPQTPIELHFGDADIDYMLGEYKICIWVTNNNKKGLTTFLFNVIF